VLFHEHGQRDIFATDTEYSISASGVAATDAAIPRYKLGELWC
jgi:hypothetical protein